MKPMSTMNVIPFIDVMLVLLAIVLTTATFVAQGRIPVNLPSAAQAEPLEPVSAIEIVMLDDGSLIVDGQEQTADAFSALIDGLSRDTVVRLKVDENTAFRHFVAVIDRLKAAELHNVSIITRRTSS